MGTPGDNRNLEKIVERKSTSPEPEDDTILPSIPVEQPSTSFQTLQPSDMGVITNLPEFHLLTAGSVVTPIASKPDSFQQALEQASIEDFFNQRKYYPATTTDNLATLQLTSPSTTFQVIDQPGPSGLQTLILKPEHVKKKAEEPPATPEIENHPCPICHKSFPTAEKFNKHYQSHSDSSPFRCDNCKKTFSSKFKLVRHALIHSDKKPFSCTVCERTFHRKDHLKNHIKIHSPTKKLYECEKAECTKQYTSLLSYRKHLAVHAAEDGNLTCQICFVKFETKDDIIYHLKIHAGSRTVKNPNEKKYVCEHCDRRFFTKKDVRRHLVVHTGMRDFLCQFCPQRFGRKDHLVRHIKKSHRKQYSDDSSAPKSSDAPKPETITSDVGCSEILDPFAVLQSIPSTSLASSQEIIVSGSVYDDLSYGNLTQGEISGKSIKVELDETGASLLTVDNYKDLGLEGVKTIFEEESLAPLNEADFILSSDSTQSELKEFCTEMFKQIHDSPPASTSLILQDQDQPDDSQHSSIVSSTEEMLDPEVFNILQEPDNNTLPLPGFSQTFQPPPPP